MADTSLNDLASGSGTKIAGATAQLLAENEARHGLSVVTDPNATDTVYLLLGTGTASASSFHIALSPGGSWDGLISGDELVAGKLWRGAVQCYAAAAVSVGVVEL